MMLHIPFRRVAWLIAAAALAAMLVPGLVAAHAELVTPAPADKATVAPPVAEVSGIYSEAMKPAGSSIVVKDATGATVAQGTVDPAKDTRMVATPSTPLGTGAYAVEWTSVALDGHVERGTWSFTVGVATPSETVTPSAAASASASAAPTAVAATPIPSAGPTPAPSVGGTTTGGGGDVLIPIVVAVILLGAGAAYLLSRRNRPPDAT